MAEIIPIKSLRARKRKPKERERITPEALTELITAAFFVRDGSAAKVSVAHVHAGVFFGVGSEDDRGFKRHDPLCAARPLTKERFDRED